MSSTPPTDEAATPPSDGAPGAGESIGVSGQGADSALARLRELEQLRESRPDQPRS